MCSKYVVEIVFSQPRAQREMHSATYTLANMYNQRVWCHSQVAW
jgi:hypothetical protein